MIGQDLTTTLNPIDVTTATIDGVVYDLSGSGSGDIDVPGLAGWDEVPDHWEVGSHEIDPKVWHEQHGNTMTTVDGWPRVVPGSTTGVPLEGHDTLEGAAANDWKDYPDRMWTIANSFQQTHTLPTMATSTPGNGFDTADLSFLPESER